MPLLGGDPAAVDGCAPLQPQNACHLNTTAGIVSPGLRPCRTAGSHMGRTEINRGPIPNEALAQGPEPGVGPMTPGHRALALSPAVRSEPGQFQGPSISLYPTPRTCPRRPAIRACGLVGHDHLSASCGSVTRMTPDRRSSLTLLADRPLLVMDRGYDASRRDQYSEPRRGEDRILSTLLTSLVPH